jgi:hypothetical protein
MRHKFSATEARRGGQVAGALPASETCKARAKETALLHKPWEKSKVSRSYNRITYLLTRRPPNLVEIAAAFFQGFPDRKVDISEPRRMNQGFEVIVTTRIRGRRFTAGEIKTMETIKLQLEQRYRR